MKVVVNATPLIALSLINQLELLNELFDEVLVPSAVYQEVVIQGAGQPGSAKLASITWIQVQAPSTSSTIEPLLLGLDTGELQVLRLAQEVQADWVFVDERSPLPLEEYYDDVRGQQGDQACQPCIHQFAC